MPPAGYKGPRGKGHQAGKRKRKRAGKLYEKGHPPMNQPPEDFEVLEDLQIVGIEPEPAPTPKPAPEPQKTVYPDGTEREPFPFDPEVPDEEEPEQQEETGRKIVRLQKHIHDKVTQTWSDGRIVTPEGTGEPANNMILRPNTVPEPDFFGDYEKDPNVPQGDLNTNMIVHRGITLAFINNSMRGHRKKSKDCDVDLVYDKVEQRGLGWEVGLKCPGCGYSTGKQKLYEELVKPKSRPGRNRVSMNVSLHIALCRQRMGYQAVIDVLTVLKIPPPSTFSLQDNANFVNPLIVAINVADMERRIQALVGLQKVLNIVKGLILMFDGRYNNRPSAGRRNPNQPGTECITLTVEDFTTDRQIIHVGHWQKLCRCPRRKEGLHLNHCPVKLDREAVISNEGKYLEAAYNYLRMLDLRISAITVDGDSCSLAKAQSLSLFIQRCLVHYNRNFTKYMCTLPFSCEVFPGHYAAHREQYQKRFGLDFTLRCQSELAAAAYTFPADRQGISKHTKQMPDTLYLCYLGDHSLCDKHSLVCRKYYRWPRPYIVTHYGERASNVPEEKDAGQAVIFPRDCDTYLIKGAAAKYFSKENVDQIYLARNTNKVEAANGVLSKSLPRNMNFLRNAPGRAHTVAHGVNNGPAVSLTQQCQGVNVALPANSVLLKKVKAQHRINIQHKERKKTPKARKRRQELNVEVYRNYDLRKQRECYQSGGARAIDNQADFDYRKSMMTNATTASADHAYVPSRHYTEILKKRRVESDHPYQQD